MQMTALEGGTQVETSSATEAPVGPTIEPYARRVVGNVGDMVQRVDETPGAVLYVKESEDGANTGWSPT